MWTDWSKKTRGEGQERVCGQRAGKCGYARSRRKGPAKSGRGAGEAPFSCYSLFFRPDNTHGGGNERGYIAHISGYDEAIALFGEL